MASTIDPSIESRHVISHLISPLFPQVASLNIFLCHGFGKIVHCQAVVTNHYAICCCCHVIESLTWNSINWYIICYLCNLIWSDFYKFLGSYHWLNCMTVLILDNNRDRSVFISYCQWYKTMHDLVIRFISKVGSQSYSERLCIIRSYVILTHCPNIISNISTWKHHGVSWEILYQVLCPYCFMPTPEVSYWNRISLTLSCMKLYSYYFKCFSAQIPALMQCMP